MPYFTRLSQRLNPVVVKAEQWFPGLSVAGVADEAPGSAGGGSLLAVPPHAFLSSGRERITVFAGDWIISEPCGRQHVCQHSLFAQTYAPAEEEEASGSDMGQQRPAALH